MIPGPLGSLMCPRLAVPRKGKGQPGRGVPRMEVRRGWLSSYILSVDGTHSRVGTSFEARQPKATGLSESDSKGLRCLGHHSRIRATILSCFHSSLATSTNTPIPTPSHNLVTLFGEDISFLQCCF